MISNLIVGPQCEEEVTLFKALLKGKVRGAGGGLGRDRLFNTLALNKVLALF